MTHAAAPAGLESHAARAVAESLGLEPNRVRSVTSVPSVKAEALVRWLNGRGLSDPQAGADPRGAGCLRAALEETLDDMAFFLRGRPVRLVDVNPESTKTIAILDGLSLRGVAVEAYLGVGRERDSLASIAPLLRQRFAKERIGFRVQEPEALAPLGRLGEALNLVTLLGFQEGHQDPWASGAQLGEALTPGDLLLSELQLSDGGWGPIESYYRHLAMRRRSRLSFESAWSGTPDTRYGVSMVPVPVTGLGLIPVAVSLEQVIQRGSPSDGLVVLTHASLKPRGLSFRELRETCGPFRVLAQNATGDRSVAFQLSDRRGREPGNALTRSWQDWGL